MNFAPDEVFFKSLSLVSHYHCFDHQLEQLIETIFSNQISLLLHFVARNSRSKKKEIEFGQVEFYRSTGDCLRELCNNIGLPTAVETASKLVRNCERLKSIQADLLLLKNK